MMADLWLVPLWNSIPGPPSRIPVNAEEGHGCLTEFPSTVLSNWDLKSTEIQQNEDK